MRLQSRENSQLFRDKEQLQWKMKQRISRSLVSDQHSQSFSGVTESSKGYVTLIFKLDF